MASRTKNDDGTPHFVTKGEKKFDREVYGGIGYLANVALSLGAVYWVERTHMGQNFMKGFVERTQKLLPKLKADTAQYLASKSFFLTGGFLVLLPMKLLEDRKVEIIKKYDREIYGDAVDTDQQIIKAHQDLEKAPSQTWSSIMLSRVTALIPFYATVGLPWSNKSMLSKATNGEFRALDAAGKAELLAKEKTDLSGFAKTMDKGWFADKPIAWASRVTGKLAARVTGNSKAVARIEEMEKAYPGMLKEGAPGERDPAHSALPYYFISELITSAIVARGVYLLTRIWAPLVGQDHAKEKAATPTSEKNIVHAPPAANDDTPQVANDNASPRPMIAAQGAEHHAALAQPALHAEAAR